MLYSQIFQELYYQADFHYNGKLPINVNFMLDEFANVPLPDDYCSLLSTMRSRNISCTIFIQNLAQIKALFEKTWETIPGNCDSLVYLGGNEQSTHKYISESLGKGTIDKKSSGETKGRQGSSSRNYDVLGRELLTPDETRKLDNSECILLIRGCDPIIDKKYNTFAHSRFSETEDGGAAPYIHDRMAAQKQAVQILSEESLDYYKKKKEQGEDVQIVELSFDEIFSYEPIPKKIFSEEELKENQKKRTVEEVRPPKKTEKPVQTEEEKLSELLESHVYNEEQLGEIMLAIGAGISYDKILQMTDTKNSAEKMKEIRKKFTKETASD